MGCAASLQLVQARVADVSSALLHRAARRGFYLCYRADQARKTQPRQAQLARGLLTMTCHNR